MTLFISRTQKNDLCGTPSTDFYIRADFRDRKEGIRDINPVVSIEL
jgi:hypothetical protein